MIHSMTGYGSAQAQFDSLTCAVEIRSVNSRYYKSRVKLPESMTFLEEDIEKLLRSNLSRGMINCNIHLKNISADELFEIDQTALKTILQRLDKLAASVDLKCPIDISNLLSLPGVVQPALPDESQKQQLKQNILSVVKTAIEKLKEMRAVEGVALAADLLQYCDIIKNDLDQVRTRCGGVLDEYAQKLKSRADELLSRAKLELDSDTLAREVAIFAERSDISEEIARLDSHLQQFADNCNAKPEASAGNSQAGRRLDFICQELLREANTIASKAADVEIIRCVVDMKCQIDRIKEQVQNVE